MALTGIIPRNPKNETSVVNLSGTNINAGDVVSLDATNTAEAQFAANPGSVGLAVQQCAAGTFPIGVAIEPIPNGAQGTIQQYGQIQVKNSAAGAIAVGGVVAPDAAGQVKATPGNVPALGVALSSGAAQGDLVWVDLARSAKS